MQIRSFVRCLAVAALTVLVGCTGDSGTSTPTGPSSSTAAPAAPATLSLTGIRSVPDGTGVQYNTDFQLTADGTFPSGTQFVWNFGDGSSTTTTRRRQPAVSTARPASSMSRLKLAAARRARLATRQVSTRSLIGTLARDGHRLHAASRCAPGAHHRIRIAGLEPNAAMARR